MLTSSISPTLIHNVCRVHYTANTMHSVIYNTLHTLTPTLLFLLPCILLLNRNLLEVCSVWVFCLVWVRNLLQSFDAYTIYDTFP